MARALIVDDEEGVRKVVSAFLVAENHDVRTAASADEALAVLAHEEFDVVISDILMPGKGGLELLELVRELAPRTRVILITGKPTFETAAEAIRHGAFEYIAKPVTRAALLRCVDAAVNVKALEEQALSYRIHLESLADQSDRQLREWHDRLEQVADHARDLGSPRAIEELAPQVLALLAQGTLAGGATFYLRKGDALELVAAIDAEHAATRIPLPARQRSVVARMLADAQAVLVHDVAGEGFISAGRETYRDGSFIGLPCVGVANQVEALIFLYNRREGSFSQQDLAIGRLIAAGAESAMRAAALFTTMQELEARHHLGHPQVLVDQAEHIFRTVRHEIGNALNTLKTTLSVLRKNLTSFDDAKREEYFARCFESFRLAEQMLHALRAFQHFDQVQAVELDLGAFLTERAGLIFEAPRGQGVDCVLAVPREPVFVHADPDALLRILINLVDNAFAALSGAAAPRIELFCRPTPREVSLGVQDNGSGIAPDHLDRVFEPLFSTKPEGSGMGLAIVQKLTVKMGGVVEMRSRPVEGTEVSLRLRRVVSATPSADGPGRLDPPRPAPAGHRPKASPLIGRVFGGRWELERILGEGAMGSVFQARHVLIGRKAALKVLHAELLDRPHLRSCFVREARAVNWVNHPNIAEIYDFGESDDGRVFLVMELLDGERLCDRIARGPVDLPSALAILEQIASALARAHDLGVVHRDLKPEHVFLVSRGSQPNFVKLIDFGLAHLTREGGLGARGALLGTPGYVAPELLRGEEAGPPADLYALGVMLFEMVTGRSPFSGKDIPSLLEQHRSQAPPDPAVLRPGLSGEVSRIILRLLEKDPARRYAEAYRLLDDCRSLRDRESPPSSLRVGHAVSSSPPAVRAPEAVGGWAQRVTLLGRMEAVAYPGRRAPAHIARAVDEMWRALSRLCQLDGELEVTEKFNDNERTRAREGAEDTAKRLGELSLSSSRLHRQVEQSREELAQLEDAAARLAQRLDELRGRIEGSEASQDNAELESLIQQAGAAAARHQTFAEATTKLQGQVERWLLEAERAAAHSEKLREQLRADSDRLAAEQDRRAARVNGLYVERAALVASLQDAERLLRDHFGRRRECRSLLGELSALSG